MKTTILLLALSVLLISSCTTAYKTGQTPDDVYYSAAKPQDEYVESEKENNRQYRYDDEYYDNRYLRMKVRNRYRWDYLDNWYSYDRYSIGYNYYFGSYYNPYNNWNYYYNPYCGNNNFIFISPKSPVSQPLVKRHFNLGGYTNTGYNNSNNNSGLLKTPKNTTTRPVYDNTNNRSSNGLSNKVRTIFSNDNTGSGSSRTYNPSSGSSGNSGSRGSSGSGNSGGSNSGGGVSRPTRN